MAGNVAIKHYKTSDLISKFGRLAQTSQYYVRIAPESTSASGRSSFVFDKLFAGEDLGLYCSEASLPGNSFATTEMNTDFPGVSQKFPYRKIYNDLQLTFYVDSNYNVIKFFESWMSNIASPFGYGQPIYEESGQRGSFRFNYPENYKCNIFVAKFNKDNNIQGKIAYRFVNAFPIDITSMPVSYDTSDILKCTVSFSYDRYIFDNTGKLISMITPTQPDFDPAKDPRTQQLPGPTSGTLTRNGQYATSLFENEKISQGVFGGVERITRNLGTIQPGQGGGA